MQDTKLIEKQCQSLKDEMNKLNLNFSKLCKELSVEPSQVKEESTTDWESYFSEKLTTAFEGKKNT